MRRVFNYLISATALTVFAQVAMADAPVSGPCLAHDGDDHSYLLKVCAYVVREKVPVNSHPNTWKITRVEDGNLKGRAVTIVHLSCCYLGDIAYFDKVSGMLVRYILGAI